MTGFATSLPCAYKKFAFNWSFFSPNFNWKNKMVTVIQLYLRWDHSCITYLRMRFRIEGGVQLRYYVHVHHYLRALPSLIVRTLPPSLDLWILKMTLHALFNLHSCFDYRICSVFNCFDLKFCWRKLAIITIYQNFAKCFLWSSSGFRLGETLCLFLGSDKTVST